MSENLRKLLGVAVMAAIVVVGVVVTNDDDSDFTRNRALRRGAESTSTSSNDSVTTALGSSTESGEVRNQSDATSLRSESSGTVETATRLDGGNELATADCCDQNAYEILKLQNQLAGLKSEIEDLEGDTQSLRKTLYEVKAESCSSNVLGVKQKGGGPMCAYLEHVNLRTVVDGVGAAWLAKSEGSKMCQLLEFGANYAGEVIEGELLGGLDVVPEQDFCSKEWVEQPADTGETQYLTHFTDKYVDFKLECPAFVSLIPPTSNKYFPWVRPGLTISTYGLSPHLYEVAPSDSWGQSGGYPMTFDYGEEHDLPKVLSAGSQKKFVQWDKTGSNWWDHFQTGSITVRITDVVTNEVHYLTAIGTVTYAIFGQTINGLQEGTAKARCEADLTIWRTYDEQL